MTTNNNITAMPESPLYGRGLGEALFPFGIATNIRSKVQVCTPALMDETLDSAHVAGICAEIEDAAGGLPPWRAHTRRV